VNVAVPVSPAAVRGFDPILLGILQNLLVAIMDECELNLSRTAFSPFIYEGKDYCVGLLDAQGRTVVQSRGSVPSFMADLGVPIQDALDLYGPEGLHEGDVLIMNFADICGQHLNNVVIYTPVHWQEKLVGFVVTRAHWTDIGASGLSTTSTEIFQEGIQFRTLKVYKRGEIDPEIMRVIRHNVRFPELTLGDMGAQVSAVELGRRRFVALIEKYGWESIETSIHAMWDHSEKLARDRLRAMPDGVYAAEALLDDDGISNEAIPLKLKVIIAGDRMTVDFSEFPPQTKGPMNSGAAVGPNVAKLAFKAAIVPEGPPNDGVFRPVDVILPPGTILSAVDNAAMSLWTVSIKTIVDVILRALSQAVPDRIPAAHHGSMGVYTFNGVNRETGKPYRLGDIVLGGWGAQPDSDGFSPLKTVTHGDTRQIPLEIEENLYPVLIERHEFRPDSAGPGAFRGGLGLKKVYAIPEGGNLMVAFERSKCPPWGLFGGGEAQVGYVVVKKPGDETGVRYQKVSRVPLAPETRVELFSSGGGGRGHAYERAPERVVEDVRMGYVTVEGAAKDYGVIVDASSLEIDQDATAQRRATMRDTSKA